MKIAIMCLVAILACSCHQAPDGSLSVHRRGELSRIMDEYFRSEDPNYPRGVYVYQFRGPLTVEQVKDELLKFYARTANIPSGYVPRNWMELKGKYRDGDELYQYLESGPCNIDQSGGYVLIRKNTVVTLLGLWVT